MPLGVLRSAMILFKMRNSWQESYRKGVFEEIRKARGKSSILSSRIDAEVGSKNIAQHFANIYQKLYNNVTNDSKLEKLNDEISKGIDYSSMAQINRIDDRLIRRALDKLAEDIC